MWKDGLLQTPELRIQITNKHICAKGICLDSTKTKNWIKENLK